MYAFGIRYFIRFSLDSGLRSEYPLFEIITGSTTTYSQGYISKDSTISLIILGEDTIPIFIAFGGISSQTAFTCDFIISELSSSTSNTPSVFCAVIAVITLIPYVPIAENIFKSAWIPAPPEESEPAIVNVGTL